MKKFFGTALMIVLVLTACDTKATSAPATVANPQTSSPAIDPPTTKAPTASSATDPTVTAQTNCTDSAAFVADVSVDDYTNFEAGAKFQKIWRVKNTGTCIWNSQYTLVFLNGNQMGAPDSVPLQETKPGSTLDVAVDMVAPSADAVYRADFEIHTPSGASIPIDQDTTLWVIITVGSTTAGSDGTGGGSSDSGSSGVTGGSSGSGGSSGTGLVNSTCAYTTNQANVEAVIVAINAYRAQNNQPAYTVNNQLTVAAQSHSADMACNNLFFHNGSNGSTPQSRAAAAGYVGSSVTENVYGSFPPLTGQGAVSWWATDPTDPRHNENLLSAKFTEIGVGYSFFNNYGYYVIVFASP